MEGRGEKDTRVKGKEEVTSVRRMELLAKLVARAKECPGLYPIREEADFLRLAMDHAGRGEEGICLVLESVWRRPDEAVQLNAQSLIRRGLGLRAPEEGGVGGGVVAGMKKQAD
jgi:hypothetical protein